MVVVSRLGLC